MFSQNFFNNFFSKQDLDRSISKSFFFVHPRSIPFIILCLTFFFSGAHSAFAAATLTQERYIFLNDSGSTTDTYTRAHFAATSTPIANVKKGERLVARIQVDNTGNASSTATWRLQWENNTDNPNIWTDVGTTTAVNWSLSQVGALTGRSGEVPVTSAQLGACTTTTTFISGRFVGGTATSTIYALGPNQCTEFAYAINTASSTSGKTYRLRLVTASTTQALNNYFAYPTFTIEPNQNIKFSKGVRGGVSSTTMETGLGESSVVIGADGAPSIVYYNGVANFVKCNNTPCTSYASSTLDSPNVGTYPSIAIGSDGFPVMSYYSSGSFLDLKFAKCNNIFCTSVSTSTIDAGGDVGTFSSMAIGSDGFPVISYYDATNFKLDLAKCFNISCTVFATSTLDGLVGVGQYSSIAIGADGFPVISYYDQGPGNLNFVKCNNVSCTSYATSSLDQQSNVGQYSAIAIGSDGYPIISYADTAGRLMFAKCNNISCTSVATTSPDGSMSGTYISLAVGIDGYPVISYNANSIAKLRFAKCNNLSCTSVATSTLDASGSVGAFTSIVIGADGFPVVTYYDTTKSKFSFLKCNSIDCRTAASSTANLPTNNVDLDSYLDDAGYNNVATIDGLYDSLAVASSSRGAYLFTKKFVATTTQNISVVWTGQESVATTTYLKIYNVSTAAWEVLGSSSTQSNATSFSITGIQSTNLKNYYDPTGLLSLRLETGTTTRPLVLSTDQVSINLVALGTTTQRAYIFMNDDLGNVASSTKSHSSATSTPITLVKKGERMIALIQIDNTAVQTSASTTRAYRLQWENNTDAPNTWTDVGTGGDIRWSYSDKGAITGRYGQVPINTRLVDVCNGATTFASGRFVAATNQSTNFALGPSKCTELGFAIQTSGATLGKTYRLRLIDGTANQPLDAYVAYPTMTIEATQNIRYSREVRGGYASSTIESTAGGYSLAISVDGYPAISYFDTNTHLSFLKCRDISCASFSTTTLDSSSNVGQYSSLIIGSDGYPAISYYDATNGNLDFAKCNDINCSSWATSSLDSAGDVGSYSSMVLGADGLPVISYYDTTNTSLKSAKCNNVSCTSTSLITLDKGAGTIGQNTSIAIGSDGYPAISYLSMSNGYLKFAKCNNISCTLAATSTIDGSGNVSDSNSLVINADGYPAISYYSPVGGDLKFAKCNNIYCSSVSTSTLDSVNDVGIYNSLVLGSDGLLRIAYKDLSNQNLLFGKCGNLACSSISTSTVDGGGGNVKLTIGVDGFPFISHHNQTTFNFQLDKCGSVDCSTPASANLPTTASDLDSYLDDVGYTNVASSDGLFDSITAGTSTQPAYLFTKHNTNNTDQIAVTWIGQLSLATSTYLQVYDNTLGAWIGFATNTTPTANTNFTLTTTLSTNLVNYYDPSLNVAVRLVTGTTTASTTLKTDQITITLGAAGSANQTLIHYRWRNDDGTEIAATYMGAEDAPIAATSSLYKGDRRRLRVTVSNAGTASAANITYRLEYASSSCTFWLPVPPYNTQSTEEWVTDLSGYLPEGAATTHSSGMSVPPGKSFVAGEARLFTNVTSPHTLTTTQYTEHEYGLRSTSFAQSNLLYCFRLTNAGSIANFTYTVQPQATLNGNPRPQYGGTGSEPNGIGVARGGGGQGGGAPVEPPAVGPPIGGGGQGGGGGDSG